jgi:ferredoxin-like protein FixX
MRTDAVNTDAKLAVDKFNVDEDSAHIRLVEEPDETEFKKLVLACPAQLYRIDDSGHKSFDYAGCLECGTCRVLCGQSIIEHWEYPNSTLGVEYRFG